MPRKRHTPFRQYVLYAYLLAASLLNLYFLQRFAMSNFHGIGAPQWILISLSTAAICYWAYTNYMLLAGKREQQKRHFFRYNLWFNIIT